MPFKKVNWLMILLETQKVVQNVFTNVIMTRTSLLIDDTRFK